MNIENRSLHKQNMGKVNWGTVYMGLYAYVCVAVCVCVCVRVCADYSIASCGQCVTSTVCSYLQLKPTLKVFSYLQPKPNECLRVNRHSTSVCMRVDRFRLFIICEVCVWQFK